MKPLEANPFAALGIAPTLDLAAIKRAYFSKVANCPPHSRGNEFRALRAAYEALTSQEQRTLAYLYLPPDGEAHKAFEAQHGARIAAARERANAQVEVQQRTERFIKTYSRMPLAKALQQALVAKDSPAQEDPPPAPTSPRERKKPRAR